MTETPTKPDLETVLRRAAQDFNFPPPKPPILRGQQEFEQYKRDRSRVSPPSPPTRTAAIALIQNDLFSGKLPIAQKPIWEFDEKAAFDMQQQLEKAHQEFEQYKRDRRWRRFRNRLVVNIQVRLVILVVFGLLSLMGLVR